MEFEHGLVKEQYFTLKISYTKRRNSQDMRNTWIGGQKCDEY